ncbi:phosphoribosylformylglycinamidine synthase subunit PurQ [Rubellicoccus peritrichatus]|uniref:phosphoribosylformylglycinamidine synthase subunit PurQ n=1 Tax=Rubellicoccus peritrichatus TaxID=3080537 RepID=UPI0031F32E72
MKVAVIQFPGSNCDTDSVHAIKDVIGLPSRLIWHKDTSLLGADAVLVPGGFSYGDYLRCGAIAKVSPIMAAVREFADNGGLVMGICNGFQILCEAGLLPGALILNNGLEFICNTQELIVEDSNEHFSKSAMGEKIHLPIAHGEGNYRIDDAGLAQLEANKQILFRYANNPNGSVGDIAGIRNEAGNVFGLMPHPERAVEAFMTSRDGEKVLRAFLRCHKKQAAA